MSKQFKIGALAWALLICGNTYAANTDVLKKTFTKLIGNDAKKLKTSGCKINKELWTQLLVTKKEFKETIKFNKDCDLEGTFTVKMSESFPMKLKIKNLKNFNYFQTNAKIDLKFTNQDTVLSLNFDKSKLSGNNLIFFSSDYSVSIDPFSKDLIKKHLGGKIILHSQKDKVIKL
jgi:hypothetical protein